MQNETALVSNPPFLPSLTKGENSWSEKGGFSLGIPLDFKERG
ncbi:unnamed protein product, partial [marine sediment metagenome]